MLMYFFFTGFFFNLAVCMTKLRVLVLCFSYFMNNSSVIGIIYFISFLDENTPKADTLVSFFSKKKSPNFDLFLLGNVLTQVCVLATVVVMVLYTQLSTIKSKSVSGCWGGSLNYKN
jgi:hypothetical protein